MSYGDIYLVNIGSGNGLLPDSTKPLPGPMLDNHQRGLVAFILWQFYRKYSRYISLKLLFEVIYLRLQLHLPGGQRVNHTINGTIDILKLNQWWHQLQWKDLQKFFDNLDVLLIKINVHKLNVRDVRGKWVNSMTFIYKYLQFAERLFANQVVSVWGHSASLHQHHHWALSWCEEKPVNNTETIGFPTSQIDPLHKSHNTPVQYPKIHHFVTEMCTCVHISVTKWCIVGYLSNALWDLWNGGLNVLMAGTPYQIWVLWFIWHHGYNPVSLVVADGLVPIWHQDICNHHDDVIQWVHVMHECPNVTDPGGDKTIIHFILSYLIFINKHNSLIYLKPAQKDVLYLLYYCFSQASKYCTTGYIFAYHITNINSLRPCDTYIS